MENLGVVIWGMRITFQYSSKFMLIEKKNKKKIQITNGIIQIRYTVEVMAMLMTATIYG